MSVDVSGSMKGNKYNVANYTAQMITALMEEDDELYFSICSDYRKINSSNKERQAEINSIQRKFSSLHVVYLKTEITDVITFMNLFKNQPERDQWQFVVGDGIWHVDEVCNSYKSFLETYPLKVFFLETMESLDEHADFGICLDDMKFVTQYRSSNDPQTIIDNCIMVATSLFGVSNESVKVQSLGNKCYSFSSEVPIKKIYIIYQDESSTKDLPVLESATTTDTSINIARQSTVSTENLREKKTDELLSGQVIVLDPSNLIGANQEVQLCFNKDIDVSKLKIFPMTDIRIGRMSFAVQNGIVDVEGNNAKICIDNNKVKLTYELKDTEGNTLPTSLLNKTVTTITTPNSTYTARLVDDVFEYELPISEQEVSYTINARCAGYFNITSDRNTISKEGECPQPIFSEMQSNGDLHINDIMKGNACISVQIVNRDQPSEILNPQDFEISAKNDYKHLFESIEVSNITDTKFDLCLFARNSLCECFIPDEVTFRITSKDKNEEFKSDSQSIVVRIDKSNTSTFERCKWIIISMIALLLLIVYLKLLNKKKRFKKGAMIRYQYFGVGGIRSRENVDDLRSKGFFSWINRWFIPFGTERTSKSFAKANGKAFSFSATHSNQRIEIPKAQYDPKQMSSIDYDRDQFERKDTKTFTMSDNTAIKITLPNGTGSFQLCYDRAAGCKDDIPAFKMFTTFIMIVAILVELVFTYLFVTSIL